jgi:hypothetical protein
VADNLVSCMAIIEGGLWELVIRSCRQGMAVLREEAFYVIAYDSWLVSGGRLVDEGRLCVGGGLGCVYSFMGSLYLNASISNCLGKYGNASLMF